jgi:hypothetical protein
MAIEIVTGPFDASMTFKPFSFRTVFKLRAFQNIANRALGVNRTLRDFAETLSAPLPDELFALRINMKLHVLLCYFLPPLK